MQGDKGQRVCGEVDEISHVSTTVEGEEENGWLPRLVVVLQAGDSPSSVLRTVGEAYVDRPGGFGV